MRQFYCVFPIRDTLRPELSWSHYRLLMRISDERERAFYAEECAKSAWSVRQLDRQVHTMYYQRLLSSQDKASVSAEIQITEPKPEYEKIVKDPYVMEFLQIKPDTHIFESDLEQTLIDHCCIEVNPVYAAERKEPYTMQHFIIIYNNFSQILKKMCPGRTKKFERISRISTGYVRKVEYIAFITV